MTRVTVADLQPWGDPDDLLRALTTIDRADLPTVRDALYELAHHDDVDVREHAMRRLFVHLRDKEGHQLVVDALRHDPEANVRRAAAFGVASSSTDATRTADAAELLRRFLSTDEQFAVREAAYESLMLLYGRRDLPPGNRALDLTTNVDWPWIAMLRRDLGVG